MFIGIDIGGSAIKSAQVVNNIIKKRVRININGTENEKQFLEKITQTIDELIDSTITAIGIGVPGIVDEINGVIYDIQNIPLLVKVQLKEHISSKYKLPVIINNDANCFAIAENHFGKGKQYSNFLGVTIGTGLGVGIIINNSIYSGKHCGAGEIGMLPYQDSIIEHYAGSLFFKRIYNTTGEITFKKAALKDKEALRIFNEFGEHLGAVFCTMLYTYAPEAIIIGGSIAKAYPYFKEGIDKKLKAFAFQEQLKNFEIHVSENNEMGILGAAALCLDI